MALPQLVTLAAVEPVFAAVSQPPVPSPIDSAAGPSEPTPRAMEVDDPEESSGEEAAGEEATIR